MSFIQMPILRRHEAEEMACVKAASFAGPYLFVNHDATNLKARPHRHAVFKHVQSSWKRWKRLDEAQTRYGPRKPLRKKEAPSSQELGATKSIDIVSDKRQSHPTAFNSEKWSHLITTSRISSPSALIRDGNSDPFNVFAVPVDAKTNALMQYTRDFYLPAIQGDINNPGLPAVRREWAECVTFLQDECLAYAHLTRIASVMASERSSPDQEQDHRTKALVLKLKTMTSLRERLAKSLQDSNSCNTILMLLNAELYARDFAAAMFHATVLARLLQSGTVKSDHIFLFKVLYHDAQRAAMSLTRPSLDLKTWIPNTFATLVDPVIKLLPSEIMLEAMAKDMDPIMDEDAALKEIFLTLKHALSLSFLGFTEPDYATLSFIFYGRYIGTLSMGRLVNHYLDAAVLLANDRLWEENSRTDACVQAYSSLAALLWLRSVSKIDSVKIATNVTIFSANHLIMASMKEILVQNEWSSFPEAQGKHAKIKLWALYVGALIEQSHTTQAANEEKRGPDECWFNAALAAHATDMQLLSWDEVRKVLQGFLYTDVLQPNGAEWFEKTMDTHMRHLVP